MANSSSAAIHDLVELLSRTYESTSDAGFIEAVELNYLTQGATLGLVHGGAPDAVQVNALFDTNFFG